MLRFDSGKKKKLPHTTSCEGIKLLKVRTSRTTVGNKRFVWELGSSLL